MPSRESLMESCRKAILAEKARLTKWLEENPKDLYERDFERGDRLAAQMLRSNNHASVKEKLADIELTLKRMDEGTWGTCDDCGELIFDERLVIIPTARRCTPCQEKKGIRVR